MRKFLVYSHDTFGLGNIRRMTEIARRLVADDPDASVLVLTGSPMLHAFRIPARIDYVKLPCLARNREGDYGTKFLSMHYQDTVRMRANLIRSAVLDFRPDLILVDKKPLGVGNELVPTLEMLDRRGEGPKLALLLRDILDTPEATIPVWRKNGYFDVIANSYDAVLVVGSPEIYDVRREYRFPADVAAKTRFCGYVDRDAGRRPPAAVREKLGVGDGKLVLACAGGGADGYELLATYLAGVASAPQDPRVHHLVVCGPEMGEAERRRLHAEGARLQRVTVEDFCDDMTGTMAAADAVVCMGGYNTVCEVLALRKRAVVVPRVKPVEEQWIRAERMARLGLFTALHPDTLSPRRLADAVVAELARDNVLPLHRVDLDGLGRVAEALRGLVAHGTRAADGEYAWHLRGDRRAVRDGSLA